LVAHNIRKFKTLDKSRWVVFMQQALVAGTTIYKDASKSEDNDR